MSSLLLHHPDLSQQRMGSRTEFSNPEVPGYVGFANLPNQVHRKSVKKGFEFTMMVVGESGLGKSTLVNSLFLTDLYPERQVRARGKEGRGEPTGRGRTGVSGEELGWGRED